MDSYARMAVIIEYLEQHYREQPELKDLARIAELSVPHFHREFHHWVGVSPKDFVRALTHEYAKATLKTGASVMESAYAAGLSGPGRLHDLCLSIEAVTPGMIKSGGHGIDIGFGIAPSPFGPCFFAETDRGICRFEFSNKPLDVLKGELCHEWPKAMLYQSDQRAEEIVAQIFAPTDSTPMKAPLRLWLRGSAFQFKVWKALLALPSGTLTTYKNIATQIAQPKSARAIGNAVGANPTAILIPCHRVIRSTGLLKGYRWGTGRKRALIAWEGAKQLCH